ncbi:MAG: hypothetical protein IJ074_07625 [Clostridia bacterium]|nr:hypothetical protein [Clostridia bacterium]MBQ8972929.1 hypothetical protein [Clostridia bacterium]
MRKVKSNRPRRKHKLPALLATLIVPPVGLLLIWRSAWDSRSRTALTCLSVALTALYVALIPIQSHQLEGGVELIGRKPQAEVYGPELPEAMVDSYIAPASNSVISTATVSPVEYVYAQDGEAEYHTSLCKKRYATSARMTPYEAYFLGLQPCPICHPSVYAPQ